MSRIRNIKPEYFKHEKIVDLPRDVRLFFIGLWPHTDRRGVFEWRPRFLRIEIFPCDHDINPERVEAFLAALEVAGCVKPFMDGTKKYGYVHDFLKHQAISGKEKESALRFPPPPAEFVQGEPELSRRVPELVGRVPEHVRPPGHHDIMTSDIMTKGESAGLFDTPPSGTLAIEQDDALVAIAGRFMKWKFKSPQQTADAMDDVLRNMRGPHRDRFIKTAERLAFEQHAKPPVWEVTKAMRSQDQSTDTPAGKDYVVTPEQLALISEIESKIADGQ